MPPPQAGGNGSKNNKGEMSTYSKYDSWSDQPRMCYKMPPRRISSDGCQCKPASFWGEEQKYNARVLNGNWFEERRMYHQLCSRCTGYSIYRTDYAPYPPPSSTSDTCTSIIPPKYEAANIVDGEGWKLLRNTEDYCDYLSNYTTTSDLMHNWEVRRAGCKPKPWRKWRIVRGVWLPESDNAVSFGNLTQYGFRKAPALPPVPNDWKTYDMETEYRNRFRSHTFPESYTLCRYATPKSVRRELAEFCLVDKPGTSNCDRTSFDSNGNTSCCPSRFTQNRKRFSNKVALSTILPSSPKQNLVVSSKDGSKPIFSSPHSCDPQLECSIGQAAMNLAEKAKCTCR